MLNAGIGANLVVPSLGEMAGPLGFQNHEGEGACGEGFQRI